MVINPTIYNSTKWKSLSGSEAGILHALLVRAGKVTMRAFPSFETIAKDSRTSRITVFRALVELEKKGCIVIIKTYKHEMIKGRNTIKRKNEYDLSIWKRFCHFKKTVKSVHYDTSQK